MVTQALINAAVTSADANGNAQIDAVEVPAFITALAGTGVVSQAQITQAFTDSGINIADGLDAAELGLLLTTLNDGDDDQTVSDLTDDLAELVASTQASLEEITELITQTAEVSFASSLASAETSFLNARLEATSLRAILQLSSISAAANAATDVANVATRYAFGLAAKAEEMYTFVAQYREKTFNAMVSVQEGRDSNTWQRIKRGVQQGFKF